MPELEWHLFATVFLIGAAYTFKEDAHVRVDVFYANKSEKWKAWINLTGIIIFLIPWCLVVIRASNKYALNAFNINEKSPDPGGLPARWIIKYVVVIGIFLLLLQAISICFKCILVLLGKRDRIFNVDNKKVK
jgi:TRAP-type mannitol/chloroaromatic compound transport system permease small subunit